MELQKVIETVVIVALVVIVGFAVIAMVQGFVDTNGIVTKFFTDVVTSLTTKAASIVSAP